MRCCREGEFLREKEKQTLEWKGICRERLEVSILYTLLRRSEEGEKFLSAI